MRPPYYEAGGSAPGPATTEPARAERDCAEPLPLPLSPNPPEPRPVTVDRLPQRRPVRVQNSRSQ